MLGFLTTFFSPADLVKKEEPSDPENSVSSAPDSEAITEPPEGDHCPEQAPPGGEGGGRSDTPSSGTGSRVAGTVRSPLSTPGSVNSGPTPGSVTSGGLSPGTGPRQAKTTRGGMGPAGGLAKPMTPLTNLSPTQKSMMSSE